MQDLNPNSRLSEAQSWLLTLDDCFNTTDSLGDLIHSLDLALTSPELTPEHADHLRVMTRIQLELLESLKADLSDCMKAIHASRTATLNHNAP